VTGFAREGERVEGASPSHRGEGGGAKKLRVSQHEQRGECQL
jgi:hypothetical protein